MLGTCSEPPTPLPGACADRWTLPASGWGQPSLPSLDWAVLIVIQRPALASQQFY